MKLKLVSKSPAQIALDDVKLYLRVLHSEEDALIQSLLAAAIDKAEQITGRALSVRTYELYRDDSAPFVLPYPPLRAVNRLEVLDGDNYVPTEYELDDKATPALIQPATDASGLNCLRVEYECGYEQIPDAIKSWIFVQVATLYENRMNIAEGQVVQMPHSFVDHLLDSYRVRQV